MCPGGWGFVPTAVISQPWAPPTRAHVTHKNTQHGLPVAIPSTLPLERITERRRQGLFIATQHSPTTPAIALLAISRQIGAGRVVWPASPTWRQSVDTVIEDCPPILGHSSTRNVSSSVGIMPGNFRSLSSKDSAST